MANTVSPEAAGLGGLLRRLRREQKFTQGEAARAAGIGRVTLVRWESGEQRPRLPELEALLAALGVGMGDRRQALGLLETPAAQALAREEVRRLADRTGLGELPLGGDLLRALRLRQGLTVEAAAARAGVRAWTLRRWEAGDSWPEVARLHALCWALGAQEEEVVALTVGPFSRLGPDPAPLPATDPALDEQLDGLRQRVALGDYALMDLHCLTLKARAWPLAQRGSAGRRLLSRACQIHAMALSFRGHLQEAKRQAERAMAVWPDDYRREPIWYYCGVLVAQGFAEGGSRWGGQRGREVLRPLLDAVAPHADAAWGGLEVWMLSETAIYLSHEGATEEALAVGTQACGVAERKTGPAELARRKSALAGLLLTSGYPAEALSLLEGEAGNTPYHATEMALVRAEACLDTDSVAAAQDWLGEAYRLIRQHDQDYLLARTDALAARA